jgi:hypothetical protein
VNDALVHARDGEWHAEHVVPKWLAGGLWQVAHDVELGWENAHDLPGSLWHEKHTAVLWPDGRAWQFWQEVELG